MRCCSKGRSSVNHRRATRDTPDSSFVYIPSLSAVVCGDIVYSEFFPWTAESTAEQRKAWLRTPDRIAALNPKIVVPGHQRPEDGTAPRASPS